MDIFRENNSKIKKIFNPKRSSKNNPDDHNPTNPESGRTLDRIVNAKEEARRQWEETQENFERRRREHEEKMIEMEKQEVLRREKEIRDQQDDLDEQRRNNRIIQEKFTDQIKALERKLEEYKLSHKMSEETLEDEISKKEDKLSEVKSSLEQRIEAMMITTPDESIAPTAPPRSINSSLNHSGDMYPTLPVTPNLSEPSPQMSHSSRSDSPSDCSV